MFATGHRVWVSILAEGPGKPPTLVPGIVTNAIVADRVVNRSIAKGGNLPLTDTIEVASYRMPPGRTPFYTNRAERVIGLTVRTEYLAIVDGPTGANVHTVVIPALIEMAARDLARLIPSVNKSQIKDAAKQYASLPALAIA